jgi:hypothetical protein
VHIPGKDMAENKEGKSKEKLYDQDGSDVAWWIQITAGMALLLMSLYQVGGVIYQTTTHLRIRQY